MSFKRNFSFIFFLFIIIFSPILVEAAIFSVSFTPINNDIYPNETAVFELSISNFQKIERRYQIYTVDPQWTIKVDPIDMRVPGESAKKFMVYITPRTGIGVGSKGLVITVKEIESQEIARSSVIIGVRSPGIIIGKYIPTVSIDVDMPSKIDPREDVKIAITLKNRNNLDLQDVLLSMYSPHFVREDYIDILPSSEEKVEYSFKLDPKEKPDRQSLSIILKYDNDTISRYTKIYEIMVYHDVKEKLEESNFLFRNKKTFTFIAEGNSATVYQKQIKSNWINRLFSKTIPKAHVVEVEDGKVLEWNISLEPGESKQVVLIRNYNIFVFILIIIILGIVGYYMFRSPIISIKEIIRVGKDEEGQSLITIKLFVKNRSGKIIENVDVFDKVPPIADIVSKETPGALAPTQISRNDKRILLRWHFDMLEPFEERLLSYKIKSRLSVVGKMSLPQAKIKFRLPSGKERFTFSSLFDK